MGVGEDYNRALKIAGKRQINFGVQQAIDRSKVIIGDYKGTGEQDEAIEVFIETLKVNGEEVPGEGDRFLIWCKRKGRELPSDEFVKLLNVDPVEGRAAIKFDPDHPMVFRSLSTYLSMGTRRYE